MKPGPSPERIEALFDAVADLDAGEAARALDAACGADTALREAVERLLTADRAGRGVDLAPPVAVMEGALRERALGVADTPGRASALPAPLISPRLGRFFVLHKLGEGGMGVIYVGYDERLDRRVALKVLRRGGVAPDWLVREAKALGRLSHPNVVAVHEVGEHEGQLFLAMELVDGPTLGAWLRERSRPFPEILGVLLQAARGLAVAHEAGIVHRDFKPDNVLVGKDGRARVVDFGIAALAAEPPLPAADRGGGAGDVTSALPMTQASAIVGTPEYMAPEQLRGERAGAASDQFAFCATAYRAVYGSPPFPAADLASLVERVLHGAPVPPPHVEGVPPWLGAILERGLSRDPTARFPSMRALVAEIERRVPRDPELDPDPVHGERRFLFRVVPFLSAGTSVSVFAGWDRFTGRTEVLAGCSAGLMIGALALVALRWKRLKQNRYGRRVGVLFVVIWAAVLAHRLVSLRLGAPASHVIVGDLVVLATFFGVVAVTIEPWFAVIALLALALAAASALDPTRAPAALLIFTLSAIAVFSILARRRR